MIEMTVFKHNIDNKEINAVSMYNLYKCLGSYRQFADFCNYYLALYEKDVDFCETHTSVRSLKSTKKSPKLKDVPRKDYVITINVAKEICLMSRTEAGKRYRRHLLKLEEQFYIELAKQVSIYTKRIADLSIQMQHLEHQLYKSKRINKSRSPYYNKLSVNILDGFFPANEYELADIEQILLYKIKKCDETIKGCEQNKQVYLSKMLAFNKALLGGKND